MHRTESQLPASPRPHLSSRQTARVTANIREHSPPPDSRARVESVNFGNFQTRRASRRTTVIRSALDGDQDEPCAA